MWRGSLISYLLLVSFFVSGCAVLNPHETYRVEKEKYDKIAQKRRVDYVRTHKLSEEFAAKILKGDIDLGMTADDIKAAWGEPYNVNFTLLPSGQRVQYVYRNFYTYQYIYFEDGVAIAIQL